MATDTGLNEMVKFHTATIEPNADGTGYKFVSNGREVKFKQLRRELDGRYGNRSTAKLQSPEDGAIREVDGKRVVQFNMPWQVFSKGQDGAYEILQGNTRKLLLDEIFAENQALYSAAKADGSPEAMANYEAKRYYFEPFSYSILPAEINPDDPSKHGYILWLQRSTNNAVVAQSALQLALLGSEYLENCLKQDAAKDKNDPDPTKRPIGKEAVRKQVAAVFGVSPSRTHHWGYLNDARQFPDIMEAMESGRMILDNWVELKTRTGALATKFKNANPNLDPEKNGITIPEVYQAVLQLAVAEATSTNGDVKIVKSHITKAVQTLEDVLMPKAPEPTTDENSGTGESGGTGEDQGTGEGGKAPKVDPYANLTVPQLIAKITTSVENLGDLVVTSDENEDQALYDEADLRTMAKILEDAEVKLAKISTIEQKTLKAEQEEQAKQEKALEKQKAKEQAKVDSKIAEVAANYESGKAAAEGKFPSDKEVAPVG